MASCSPDRSSSSSEEMDPGREAFQLLYGLIRKTPTQCGGSPVLPEKVDPVSDDSVSSSSDAGPRKTLPPSSSSVAGVPWCLNQINPGLSSVSSMSHFSCILCARVFDKVKDLIRHVDRCHQHSRGKTLDEEDDFYDRTCAFCGQYFPSSVSKVLHQMSEPLLHRCPDCDTVFDDAKDERVHYCSQSPGLLLCPLGCPREFRFTAQTLLPHLEAVHGKSDRVRFVETSDTAPHVAQVTNLEEFTARCPNCKISVNPLNVSLESHALFHCLMLGTYHKECVKSIRDYAEANSLDPLLLIRLELESFAQELIRIQEAKGASANLMRSDAQETSLKHVQYSEERDQNYANLPEKFYQSILAHSNEDEGKEEIQQHVSDRNYPYLSFLLSRSNEYLSDQFSASETLSLLARTVRLSLQRQDDPKKPGLPVWNKDYVNTREVWEAKQPSSELLKKLENELGFPVLDTSDMALLKDRMGKNLKRDRGDMSSGLPVITGTKQRDPSPEKKKPR